VQYVVEESQFRKKFEILSHFSLLFVELEWFMFRSRAFVENPESWDFCNYR